MSADKSGSSVVGEELPQLLFELSHGWRLEIMLSIKDHPRRHSDLTKNLRISPQEATRHLLRLVEVKLIEKDTEGLYHPTAIGRLVLTFIPALTTISKYSDFFLTHDLSGIPYQFILRLGELSGSSLQKSDTFSTLSKAFRAIGESKGQISLINVGRLEFANPIIEGHGNGPKYRCILPTRVASLATRDKSQPDDECRYLDEVKIVLILTSDRAAICLPDAQGKMDYTVFLRSEDPEFRKWCKDLFEYYWERAATK